MTNVSAVEKMAEIMQQMEENSPRVAALQYCLSEVAKRITELEQKLAVSQREFRAADATIENLQMQVEKLAAENAGLKRFPDQIVSFIGKLGSSEIGRDTKEKIEFAANKVQTPVTDAFLAEVRAQGADECVRKLVTSDDDDFSDAPNICAMVAYQLRKGVQS